MNDNEETSRFDDLVRYARKSGLTQKAAEKTATRILEQEAAQDWRKRAELAEAKITAALALHVHKQIPISASTLGDVTYPQGCGYCESSWPCATVRALSDNSEGNE